MKQTLLIAAASMTFLAAPLTSAHATNAAQCATSRQPDADAILRQMSDTLGAARQFSFTADREVLPALAVAHGVQANAQIEVTVRRPDAMLAVATGKTDVRRTYFDGRKFTILDVKENLYSTVPMRGSLDTLPALLANRYGFTPPLSEFITSNPYEGLRWRAQSISYAGKGFIRTGFLGLCAVECHRIALTGELADAELWIGVSDHLPRKLIATVKGKAGTALTIGFRDWDLNAPMTSREFVFTPPKGAQEIPMIPTSAMKKTAVKN